MPTKVLVFESDSAFASELRAELGKLGCAVRVVEDGNVGLQQAQAERPDLILLAIELPRMNGFSVCNKLKKDTSLRDVPLIIMSTESSDETFEQHKKLRTRAEAYVHKPVTFASLRHEIDAFVSLPGHGVGDPSDDGSRAASYDDATEVPGAVEVAPDSGRTAMFDAPDFEAATHVESAARFTGDAFARLQTTSEAAVVEAATAPPSSRQASARARREPSGRADAADLDRARAELERVNAETARAHEGAERARAELGEIARERDAAVARAEELSGRVRAAEAASERARTEAEAESAHLKQELEDLRGRTAAASARGGSIPPKAGATSREFLDLREALSKKDKELLGLKQQLAVKDKEIFEIRERSLAYETRASELDDRVLEKDKELAEAGEKLDELTGHLSTRDEAIVSARGHVAKLEADLGALRARREEEAVAHEAAAAALTGDRIEAEARLKSEHAAAMDAARGGFKSELDAQAAAHASAVLTVKADADRARGEALAAREAELKAETDAKLASLHRIQKEELQRGRSEAEGRERALSDDLLKTQARLADVEQQLAEVTAARAALESQFGAAKSKAAALEEELGTLRGELDDTRKNLVRESSRATRALEKWDADRASLERAKDALAVALSQLDEAEARQISE